ncbi:dipeptide epimerase [Phenylobacterium sp.]|uniref:dipeptide epimerase n=1 Tax=Phenylobacterium sp. TaxID=1871053 RepID=UPI0028A0AB2B|nr:dipeptide epimerase [Phenylobacterium sp.]
MTRARTLEVAIEDWPLIKPFAISRSVDLSAVVVVVRIQEGDAIGRGEATPYAHYGETPESVVAAIEACRDEIESGSPPPVERLNLRGAASNAVDCALVDLAAKRAGVPAWSMLHMQEPTALVTTATVTLDTPERMAADAAAWADFKILKLKLGEGEADVERVAAVRRARPDARLICDANEGWSLDQLANYAGPMSALGIEMIEQPCKAGQDEGLRNLKLGMPLCADESCHVAADVEALVGKYQLVSIKLDKTGGLNGALDLAAAAKNHGMGVMMGCMLSTSLAIAPGLLAGQGARYVDLDGPTTLARDRDPPMRFENGMVHPASPVLWG